jgi:hypothetical protein
METAVMKNVRQRMGKLVFVRQTRDTVSNVSIHLHQRIAERPPGAHTSVRLHLVSGFGGGQEIGAAAAATLEGLRFQVSICRDEFSGSLGEKPTVYRSSLQTPGRKRPVRHLALLSRELMETTLGADGDARGTALFDSSADFVLHRLSTRFGIPVLPEWADWFLGELHRRRMIEPMAGWNCNPVPVIGTKLRILRVLSQGFRRRQISVL